LRRRRLRTIVFRREASAEVHWNGERREESPGDVVDAEELRFAVMVQRHASTANCQHIPERGDVPLDVTELLVGQHAEAVGGRGERDVYEPRGVRDRQGSKVDRVQEGEHRAVGADAGGQGGDGHDRVSRLMDEDPNRPADVLHVYFSRIILEFGRDWPASS